MHIIIEEIRGCLAEAGSAEVRETSTRFFKADERVDMYGVKSAGVKAVAKDALKKLKGMDKKEIFAICDELWKGKFEENAIACELAYSRRKDFVVADMKRFERWIDDYVGNWAACDTLCNHSVGAIVEANPTLAKTLKKWTKSANRWKKRAAAVSLIIPARKGLFLDDAILIAESLLLDPDHMVQKGYGWLLKAASEAHPDEVYKYVVSHRQDMPRTAYRYAIEKLPREMRADAMKKE